ncbi:MAG: membrane protein [Peptococcaceae bacterium BICA1-7]|nr:MAG: membrane protein [Peptococcaceae bacterium BICA1-7]HBV97232.1 phage holin family protein [Desulfotomaculum sp.]
MKWLITLAVNSAALLVADWLLRGMEISGVLWAVIAAVVLGVVNTLIRPVLLVVTLPLTAITLGLFIFIINAITFTLAALLVPGFHVYSFGGAFWGAIITSLVSWLLNGLVSDRD